MVDLFISLSIQTETSPFDVKYAGFSTSISTLSELKWGQNSNQFEYNITKRHLNHTNYCYLV